MIPDADDVPSDSTPDAPPPESAENTGSDARSKSVTGAEAVANSEAVASAVPEVDDGPGWLPAILAATALMGIAGFIFCGFSTWVLFQKRTEFAVRTLEGAYLPEIEQSLLSPEAKADVTIQIRELADDMKRGKYENWQSAGILQRLQRMPVLQWGELDAVESFITKSGSPEQADEASKQFSRLRKAVQMGRATTFDFYEVLTPVKVSDASVASGQRLMQPLDVDAVMAASKRAKLVADREQVPDETFVGVRIETIVRGEIDAGVSSGGF